MCSGADDYLAKPFAFVDLLGRIEALTCKRGGVHKSKVLCVADLELDRQAHRVWRVGRLVDLTPKEFVLLECFLLSPGKVSSRTRLLEQVWSLRSDLLINIVNVYIRQLRKKIDVGHQVKLFKTVQGLGNKLDGS